MSAVRVPDVFCLAVFGMPWMSWTFAGFELRPFSPPLALFASKRRSIREIRHKFCKIKNWRYKRTPWHTTLNILT